MTRAFRDYILTFGVRGGTVTVRPPHRITFNVDKSTRGGLNKARITIENIEESKRLQLVKDAEDQKRITVELSVGYKGSIEPIYKGTILTGSNERQGASIITNIESLDGGFDGLNSFTNRTVEGGRRAVDAALSDMPNTTVGQINERPVLSRPKVLIGNSLRLIEETIGENETWFIDNEQLYIISDSEVVGRFIPVVSAETGLISTPTRKNKEVTFQTKMNPSIKLGGSAKLISQTAPHLNGTYRVDVIGYAGDNNGDAWDQTCTGFLISE
jgi:hypothetical protein